MVVVVVGHPMAGQILHVALDIQYFDTTTRPYITNANAITHCYNGSTNYGSVGANQATYLGSVFVPSAGTINWQYGGDGVSRSF